MIKYFFLLFIIINLTYSQCSDAGICFLGKKQKNEIKQDISSVSLGYRYGYSGKDPDINGALNDLIFNSIILSADLSLTKNSRFSFSIPFTLIEGPLGSNRGIGDLTALYSRSFVIKKTHNLTFSAGGKISVADVNTTDSLPQRYMPGFGTNDLIVGATYSYQAYSVSVAYQKPFGRNANFKTRLKRGDDILLRAGYSQLFGKLNVKGEILTIIRIQRSSVLGINVSPQESFIEIEGSNEPQVNLLASVGYYINDKFLITGEAALPFLHRNYNFDGLKRAFTAGISVSYLFNL
ncbi:MAG TPA: hypothetical protein VGK25_00065 [Ignavibacteria bacterium]|jgi:hypothetical protein